MNRFAGFPDGKQPFTPVPNLFFTRMLPEIDHLAELKVTLHVFWLLGHRGGDRPCVSAEELAKDSHLLAGLRSPGIPAVEALYDALERAVGRGTLLQVSSAAGSSRQAWYFLNSEKGRQAVEDVKAGRWAPAEAEEPVRVQRERPNIYALYEQNIGPLTPILSEELLEAEKSYPASWIDDAFREAVKLNKRNWRYIERILERWAAEGRGDETYRRGNDRDRRRFIEGEYADFVEH
jgi:DNA replication protein